LRLEFETKFSIYRSCMSRRTLGSLLMACFRNPLNSVLQIMFVHNIHDQFELVANIALDLWNCRKLGNPESTDIIGIISPVIFFT
jgi:hypothetical protein